MGVLRVSTIGKCVDQVGHGDAFMIKKPKGRFSFDLIQILRRGTTQLLDRCLFLSAHFSYRWNKSKGILSKTAKKPVCILGAGVADEDQESKNIRKREDA